MTSTTRFQSMPVTEDNLHLVQVAHDDMKQVSVTSTATSCVSGDSDPFTLYTIVVTCPSTKLWWIIKKRYSEFYALRQYFRKMQKACKNASLNKALKPLMDLSFPKRSFRLDTEAIINERKRAFDAMTAVLMAIRSHCLFTSVQYQDDNNTATQLGHVCDVIEAFLCIPDLQKNEEIRRTEIILSSPDVATTEINYKEHADDDCPICLCDFDSDDKVLHLGCGHNFHEGCVMQWIQLKMSCPICRQTSICGIAK
ncbi:hypothetical protein Ae201684P_011524 [Aphanomyces euteiches]|uniref:RING-type domain-containing protein n=2 Tax=Aphanomyces euteiches TaxID=100861 RepID=A0A6G0XXG5_9STRA|nr:hypothetical protein Ae201684_000448 [Aphanomyces euteiches]KAH9091984.1 hypothetical protein Ae201684P_011524 [Aphanomyces euteiches]